eukprot:Skav223055  [mRNA]  locus=scaffold1069:374046:374552:+ [translate_table: standard]
MGDGLSRRLHSRGSDSESEGSEDERGILDWFRKSFSFKFATYSLLALLFLFLGYHILILTHVVPSKYVWGGRLKSNSSMLRFEAVSLSLNLFFVLLVVLRAQLCCAKIGFQFCLKVLCWISYIIFTLNTIGNLLAQSWFEMLTFAPVTFYVSMAFARLALGDLGDDEI